VGRHGLKRGFLCFTLCFFLPSGWKRGFLSFFLGCG